MHNKLISLVATLSFSLLSVKAAKFCSLTVLHKANDSFLTPLVSRV